MLGVGVGCSRAARRDRGVRKPVEDEGWFESSSGWMTKPGSCMLTLKSYSMPSSPNALGSGEGVLASEEGCEGESRR